MIKTLTLNIDEVGYNPNNPRAFSKNDLDKMIKSILNFPEMLEGIRCIAVKNKIVLGGNLRLKGLREIASLAPFAIANLISNKRTKNTAKRTEYLTKYWNDFLKTKNFTFIDADNLTDEQADEFTIKDNVAVGSWDVDLLTDNWNLSDLIDWNLDIMPEIDEENDEEILETETKKLKPYSEVHFLCSFHPDLASQIAPLIEQIQRIEGVICGQCSK